MTDKLYDITQNTPVDKRQEIANMLGVPLEQVHAFTMSEAEALAASRTSERLPTMTERHVAEIDYALSCAEGFEEDVSAIALREILSVIQGLADGSLVVVDGEKMKRLRRVVDNPTEFTASTISEAIRGVLP